jgi:hypothetical protein
MSSDVPYYRAAVSMVVQLEPWHTPSTRTCANLQKFFALLAERQSVDLSDGTPDSAWVSPSPGLTLESHSLRQLQTSLCRRDRILTDATSAEYSREQSPQ